jgi:hypothetical protein
LYRTHESGNDVKSILGTSNLCWKTDELEGAYRGQKVFDHNQPNTVTNEMRQRSREMRDDVNTSYKTAKDNMTSNYVSDWSTESTSYKQGSGKNYTQPTSLRNATGRSTNINDENVALRPMEYANNYSNNGGSKGNSADYDTSGYSGYSGYSGTAAAAAAANRSGSNAGGGASGRSSMGGMSLAQFQSAGDDSDRNSQQQVVPKYSRNNSSNSSGFASTMGQHERGDPSYNAPVSSSRGMGAQPRGSSTGNNIFGNDSSSSGRGSVGGGGSAYEPSYGGDSAAYKYQQMQEQKMQAQYRDQYQAPAAANAYEPSYGVGGGGYGASSASSYGGSSGRYPQQQQDDGYGYSQNIPGIAAEGAGNREGRSTRPW